MTLKIPDTLRKQLEKATAIIERIFEEDLLAIHLYGSAVEGGLGIGSINHLFAPHPKYLT
ncbi:hypothetical protein VC596_25245 [Citrobacter freundii]|nr:MULTISPECIES: hypothetical protein [Enterobacteriaceae]AWX04859.1 hypothetical protein DPF84_24415 [Enterobacter hormaechei]MCL8145671.1 hypothetical protein [Enterobacter hormaechei]MCM7929742.1 hypothetical protein [Enterobacter hormaechei]MCM7949327.1 hypothetical protein [Enterobacter hormaechei]MDV0486373.1 hypothetical protein [Citrobacter freundii]